MNAAGIGALRLVPDAILALYLLGITRIRPRIIWRIARW